MMKPFSPETKWVFLDLDNTLWDFDGNAEEALKTLFHRHQLNLHTEYLAHEFVALYQQVNAEYWRKYERGEIGKEVLRSARFYDTFLAMGIPESMHPEYVWKEYLDICPVMTRMMPGAHQALKILKSKYRVALLTNGFEATQRKKMLYSDLEPFVDFMMSSEAVGVAKPARAFFDLAMEKAGCLAREAVYLGDTWHTDVLGGMGAGIQTYWYRRKQNIQIAEAGMNDPYFGGIIDDLLDFAQLGV